MPYAYNNAMDQSDLGSEYFANQDVIIYSASQGGWVPARVESANADDSVTVKYATGHTKLVPLEYQSTHLRPADEPPPEPMPKEPEQDYDLFNMPSILNVLMPGGGSGGGPEMPQMPSMASFAGNSAGGQMPSVLGGSCWEAGGQAGGGQAHGQHGACTTFSVGQQVTIYSESSKAWMPGTVSFVAPNGCVTVKYANGNQKTLEPERHHLLKPVTAGSGQAAVQPHVEHKASSKYSVNQQVTVYSESSKSWVLAKVTGVAPNGCVTVSYGNGLQKTLEPARHHLLSPVTTGSGPQSGQPMSRVAPAASARIEMPKFDLFGNPASGQCGQGAYASNPPAEQAGTFQFDLAQLCNDAAQPSNAQANHFGGSVFVSPGQMQYVR